MIGAAALLAIIRPGMTWAIVLWFPLTVLLGLAFGIVLLEISPPKLEHYSSHGSLNLK